MKLKLTKSWYANRAKAEENCSDIAAGASVRPITTATQAKEKDTSTATNSADKKTSSSTSSKARRKEK